MGLTRLGIKPKSTASEADALTTRPSELVRDEDPRLQPAKQWVDPALLVGLLTEQESIWPAR